MSQYSVEALQFVDELKIDELMDLRKAEFKYQDSIGLSDEALALQLEKEKLKEIREQFWDESKEYKELLDDLKSLSDHPALKDKERLLTLVSLRPKLKGLSLDKNSEKFLEYLKDIFVATNQVRNQKKKAFYDEFRREDLVSARKVVRKLKKENLTLYSLEQSWFDQILNPRAFSDPKTSEIKESNGFPWWGIAIAIWFILKLIMLAGK